MQQQYGKGAALDDAATARLQAWRESAVRPSTAHATTRAAARGAHGRA